MSQKKIALYLGLCWLSTGCSSAGGDKAGAGGEIGQRSSALIGDPTTGGPYDNLPTYLCSDLGGSYCYSAEGDPLISTESEALPYLDNAAKNWGCDWSLSQNTVQSPGNNNFYKWYGTVADPAQGCGIVWWNHARQAAYFMPNTDTGGNVAASSHGAIASASSTLSPDYPVSAVNDSDSMGDTWGSGGGWSSDAVPSASAPQWVQIDFPEKKTINSVEVTTLQDNYSDRIEPTLATRFFSAGIVDFSVSYWDRSRWVDIAYVRGNDKVVRRFTFAPVLAGAIRVTVTDVVKDDNARIVEIRAFETSSTSSKLYSKYCALGCSESGPLGLPISNPTPYGFSGATYQQFTDGIITYVFGNAAAFAVGGTAVEDKALAARYASFFGISPSSGPSVYGLAHEPGCTNTSGTGCGSGQTGRYVKWWNSSNGYDELLIARTGWRKAVHVPGEILAEWVQTHGATAPWNGALGFPITDLLPTGSATHHQEFEKGTILWELDGCSSGRYTARIVLGERPISEGNLTMLCESNPPPNTEFSPESAPIPFNVGGRTGSYTYHSGPEKQGWFKGVILRFDDGQTFEVNGAFYDEWIGGAYGRGNVATALIGGWGEPLSDADCVDNPCTMMKQIFRFAITALNMDDFVVEPIEPTPGVVAPSRPISYDWGYTDPQEPADLRLLAGQPRSGDYVTLGWFNKSTAIGVTTTLWRAVTPLNGTQSEYVQIQIYSPPTLPEGTATVYTDDSPTNNAKNCYKLSVSDGMRTKYTEPYCIYTLDRRKRTCDRTAPGPALRHPAVLAPLRVAPRGGGPAPVTRD